MHHIEVCIDNIESLHYAISGGATRIELCSSLALGGLTPNFGLMKQTAKASSIPVYAMIRPRQGDFLYSEEEIEIMLSDVEAASEAGLDGIVFGLLTQDGHIDIENSQRIAERAKSLGLGMTYHRAIDQCADMTSALEAIISLGCERILTSGLAPTAIEGVQTLADMVAIAKGRIEIMAGAGVNIDNVETIIKSTGVTEVHLSGKTTRSSHMVFVGEQAKMGAQDVDDFAIPITNTQTIRQLVAKVRQLG